MCPDVMSQKDCTSEERMRALKDDQLRGVLSQPWKGSPPWGNVSPFPAYAQLNPAELHHHGSRLRLSVVGQIWSMRFCIIQRGTDRGLIFNNMIKRESKMGIPCKSIADLAKSILQILKGKILDRVKFTKITLP